MIKEKYATLLVKILCLVFIGVFSVFVLAPVVPKTDYVQETLNHLEEDKATVTKFSGVTIGTSFAISLLPDDFGTPVANTLADMNKYFIFIFVVVFVERLIVVEGIKIAFLYMIPVGCAIYGLALITSKNFLRSLAIKLFVLAASVVVVIPFTTHFTRTVGADYLAYVNETIDETNAGIEQITKTNDEDNQNKSLLDKVSDTWNTATQGVTDAVEFLKGGIAKFGNAIAVLIVTTFVLPVFILIFFKWLLNQLFRINLYIPQFKKKTETVNTKEIAEVD